jgi:hypothetical protein
LQNVSQRSVTVMWESDGEPAGRLVLLGEPERVIQVPGGDPIAEVVIDGLEPGRRYRYQVEVEGGRVDGEFATAPEAGAPFSFVVFGDSRSNPGSHRNVVERVMREVPDFILGTGDMVNEGHNEADWQTFFEVERELLRENVLYPSLGNHDRQGRGRTADNFRKYFALPENSPNPERYYAFTYGSARFLVLDSNAYSFALTDQTAWIEEQLQAARLDQDIEHLFVTMHHPPFSTSLHGGHQDLRDAWTPLFERYQVDAVFSGHDHTYERSAHGGVRYFVSGGGGAPLYPRSRRPAAADRAASQYFERVNHYLRVHVMAGFVEVTAIRGDGSVIEAVSWGSARSPAQPPVQLAAVAAAGGPVAPARVEVSAPAVPAGGGGFGMLGWLAVALSALSAGVLVWAVRR